MPHGDDTPVARPDWMSLAREHLGLVVAAVPILLSLVRVFAVAGGDRATLVTLLSTLDVKALLLGTFSWMFPSVVGVVAAILWVRWLQQKTWGPAASVAGEAVPPWSALLAASVALVLFALAPVNDLVNLVICLAGVVFFRKPERNRLGRVLLIGGAFLVLIVGPVVFRAANMWLPAEQIVVKGRPVLVGYVLSVNNLDVTVLDAATSTVHRLGPDDVESRAICRLNLGWESASLVSYLNGQTRPRTPVC